MTHPHTSHTDTSQLSPEPVVWLVYSLAGNGGAVFDTVDHAIYADAVHGALQEAKTWGEFRRLLPEGEWETVEERLSEAFGDELLQREDEEENEDEPAPERHWENDAAPFTMSDVPGLDEGDYPAWRQADMEEVVPEDLLEAFGKIEASPNGPFWLVPHENAAALADALRLRGYHVEEASFLRGY